jgi:hypothetical protein
LYPQTSKGICSKEAGQNYKRAVRTFHQHRYLALWQRACCFLLESGKVLLLLEAQNG